MTDERQFIQQIEQADPATFARLLINVTPQKERALHTFFGSALYQHMRGLAIKSSRGPKGKGTPVVVVPGMFGSTLLVEAGERDEHLWLNPVAVARGELDRMRLGGSDFHVHAGGVLKRNYGVLLLSLLQRGPVHAFASPAAWVASEPAGAS